MALYGLLEKKLYFLLINQKKTNMNSILLVIGWPQIVLIVVIVLILFGGKKLPELMKGLGKGMKEFKDATKELNDENKDQK